MTIFFLAATHHWSLRTPFHLLLSLRNDKVATREAHIAPSSPPDKACPDRGFPPLPSSKVEGKREGGIR